MSFPRLHRLLLGLSVGLLPAVTPAAVVINEIHANPDVKTERVEFVELHNTGTNTVAVGGWRLTDAVDFTIPAGTSIPALGYLVVAENPAALQAKFGAASVGPWTGRLSSEGERLRLRDAAGAVVDEVTYGLGFPWPTVGDAPGYSIELIHPSLDNDLGGSWRGSRRTEPPSTTVLVPSGAEWLHRKGTAEASTPVSAWRSTGFVPTGWTAGNLPIGYDSSATFATPLDDMSGNYSSVYLRREFVVTNFSDINALILQARYDDGFKVWINGTPVLDPNAPSGEVPFNGTSSGTRESDAWETFSLPDPASYLVPGTNVLAVQLLNTLLSGSSDCFLDLRLDGTSGSAQNGPTPGRRNAVVSQNAPPQLRQVDHAPRQPRSGEPVLITVKATDPDGVAQVSLEYQLVQPGGYVEVTDPAYATSWTTVPMNDAGLDGDVSAGDSIYSATLPGTIQQHRRLIRYRITTTDATGQFLRVPYADDPQPNFAYFVYDGVPEWSGAVRPGTSGALGQKFTVSSNEMNRLPVYHLVSKQSEVEAATWTSRYGGDLYLWNGTLVYDGRVYDNIRFRARGGVWRYAMEKNMWKFDFNRGHEFRAKDNWGRELGTRWKKLNLGASIQQGDYGHRGEQGMFESVGLRLFGLAGVPAPHTTYVQFRVVDAANQVGAANQYSGDFWGVYLALEQEDGQFLDQHGLPDGNLYKMENGTGELNNLAPDGPADKSDLNAFLGNYNNQTEAWWRTNLNVPSYLSYQTIVQAIHHYDICYGKNYFYYRNPTNGLWQVIPWDLDLTWADNMYDEGCGGVDAIKFRLLPNATTLPNIWREWQSRIREIRDLLWNEDEAWRLLEEHASLLRGPATGPTLLDADRAQWDYHPRMGFSAKAGSGRFYVVGGSFNGAVQRMKDYVLFRSTNSAARARNLDSLAADPLIPQRPIATYMGSNGFPANRLAFRASAFLGPNPFHSMKWRIGEISPTNTPAYLSSEPWKYEIEPVWETGELTTFQTDTAVPSGALRVGRTYRARVRFTDVTGRTSRWSEPVEFTVGAPDNAAAVTEQLRLTELMFNPPGGSDFEFVELQNTGTETTLDLAGLAFTAGITYTFPAGATLAPGAHALVVRAAATDDFAAFRAHYGLAASVPIFGPYSGSLADGGETLTLKAAAGGANLISFEYGDSRLWPIQADGPGHSLVPLGAAAAQPQGSLDYPFHWTASSRIKGSPGAAEPALEPALVLNEIVAHTDFFSEEDSNDWIELHNRSAQEIVLGTDWYLSDSAGDLKKWAIPAGTVVPALGYVVFDEVTGFHSSATVGFGLSKAGEQVFLSHLPGDGSDRVVDAVRFAAEENDWSWGRAAGSPNLWAPLTPRTRGGPNGARPAVPRISEVHFNPAPVAGSTDDNVLDEFVEITGAPDGGTNFVTEAGAWRLDGDVSFDFPAGFHLPANGTVLVVGFDPASGAALDAFRGRVGLTNLTVPVLGPWSGKLSNRSGQITLEKPQPPEIVGEPVAWVVVDETVFFDQAPWPVDADGSGSSLQLLDRNLPGTDPLAWTAASPSPGRWVEGVIDTDGDSMPDAWEDLHGLDKNNPADAALDKDLDGASNADEFASGTSATDAESVLRLESIRGDDELLLRWRSAVGVAYEVVRRDALANGDWQPWTNLPSALVEGTNEVRTPRLMDEEAFRIRVLR